MRLFHVSFDVKSDFAPRIPSSYTRMAGEDDAIPRVCGAPTIEGCLSGMPLAGETAWRMQQLGIPVILHVYELSSEKVMSNQEVQKYVPDAVDTGETWILDTPTVVGRADYEMCQLQFHKVYEQNVLFHTLAHCKLRRAATFQDNVENLLDTLQIRGDTRKKVYGMMTKTSFTSLLMSMYEDFVEMM